MSEERLLSMDEGALRKLLEATLDLTERRQIRSAIRELRRQELERDEEALASKRFRTERCAERQENKENVLRSLRLEEEQKQQQKTLDILSGKLETIQDVEELTALMRAASEYEERKLIRAAIRKLRAEEIEAAALAGKAYYNRRETDEALAVKGREGNTADGDISEVQERELIRAQIRELRSQQRQDAKPADMPDSSTPAGTLLLLDPVAGQAPAEPPSLSESGPDPESSAEASSRDSDSRTESPPASEEETGTGRISAPEDREGLRAPEGGSAASEPLQGLPDAPSAVSDSSQEEEASLKLLSKETAREQDAPQAPEQEADVVDSRESVSSAAPSSAAPQTPAPPDAHCGETTQPTPRQATSTDSRRDQPFQRSGSVLDRARKFSSEPPKPAGSAGPPRKAESAGKGARILQQQQQLLNPPRAGDLPAGARGGSSGTAGRALQDASRQRGAEEQQQPAKPSAIQAKTGTVRPPAESPAGPKEAASPRGRSQAGQWQGSKWAPARPSAENTPGSSSGSKEPHVPPLSSSSSRSPLPARARNLCAAEPSDEMKTLFTIEIKDGRSQPLRSQIVATPGNQRAELTLGLRSTPIRITTTSSSVDSSSHGGSSSSLNKMEAEVPVHREAADSALSNGTEKEKLQAQELHQRSRLSAEELSKIEEEHVLDKMLDQTTDFEERRLIRAAMRELRQRKREQREKERSLRIQEAKSRGATHTTETTARQSAMSADGSAISTVTKTQRLVQSNDGSKTSRTMMMESSYVKRSETDGNTFVQTKSSYSTSSSKKVGSIFEREDETSGRAGSLAALERRQAEKKKELMKAQSLPKTSASQARKAMIEKLEKESGSPANPAVSRVAVQRSGSFGVPNASSIKQMLLDWCRAKTRGYEHVDIQNFSSSWSDGMAFCALVHNFFPEAFDYAQLSPQDRRRNFEMAFSAAETHAECPQLLDVEDMVRMREPDWKCVYTYIQEFYRCLVQKGLVKTKKS
ncbi:smoothelin isoform X2 [Podarcis lilfordi]|uniref:Smoothelin isoform X2 n=2 Tax=Podarcis lilfordi TaxID=74358 RepID=A0AA35LKM9_9SAUR|nr:smoothelin isoform X2 [Podarcis lilfordi]